MIIDTHNHSLPYIDDGAVDINMSLKMLQASVSSGVTDIILTPHHLNGAFNNFADSVIKNTKLLRQEAQNANIDIRLHHGSEVHLTPETVDQLLEHKALTYCGNGKAALIELPKNSIPTGVESILSDLIYHGITPIIAHPERNSSLRRDFTPLREWVEFGCKSQVTGQSCTGGFGESLQKLSFKLIANNLVHLVASDAHRPSGRSPDLKSAQKILEQKFGTNICKTLLYNNPKKLIKGEDLESLGINPQDHIKNKKNSNKKKSIFSFFRKS